MAGRDETHSTTGTFAATTVCICLGHDNNMMGWQFLFVHLFLCIFFFLVNTQNYIYTLHTPVLLHHIFQFLLWKGGGGGGSKVCVRPQDNGERYYICSISGMFLSLLLCCCFVAAKMCVGTHNIICWLFDISCISASGSVLFGKKNKQTK